MEIVKGNFEKYIFYNELNGYSIIKLSSGIVAVGAMAKLNEGDILELFGDYTTHPKFGRQFKIVRYNVILPTTNEGIVKYLGSGLIKGIGEKFAEKIYKHFGERTLEILENDIDKLREVGGIGAAKLESIKRSWSEQHEVRKTMIFLQSHGVTANLAIKIFKTYGKESEKYVLDNPYRLSYDIWGVGFQTADKIARNMGYDEFHPKRLEAGIIYVLTEAMNDGHVYLTKSELVQRVFDILSYNLLEDDGLLDTLKDKKQILAFKDRIYLPVLYYSERKIEESLNGLLGKTKELTKLDEKYLELVKGNFSEEQIQAIRFSIEQKVLIITGGPGTGKTTTLKGIIELNKKKEKRILLAAPTGRAAKRMTEIIGLEAKTIHRLLEYNPVESSFGYNADKQLETDLLIIDEVSMIDTFLMYNLVIAIDDRTTVIFVGDVDQLPSIGPGNVLHDMINSKLIPCVNLTKIFRQAEESKIIMAAHAINKGMFPRLNEPRTDFVFIEEEDVNNVVEKIRELSCNILPQKYKYNLGDHIQILSPMYRGEIGVNNINYLLQEEFNKNEFAFQFGDKKYKIDDKVMQLRNNYDKGIFNGDIGFIHSYEREEHKVRVSFDGKIVDYDFAELDEITLAYAITVHKSQGSEYPCVIMPLSTAHYIMLQRNLVYTAITRASKLLIMVGTKKALMLAIKNNKIQQRNSSLFKFNGTQVVEYEFDNPF